MKFGLYVVLAGRLAVAAAATTATPPMGPADLVLTGGKIYTSDGARSVAEAVALDILDLDVCSLDSKPLTLKELSAAVSGCLAHYPTPPGQLLVVHQWNYTAGNQPDPQHPTLRAALDAASTRVGIQLLGNDAHHSAFNSLALSQAKNARGQKVGLSRATLAGEFSADRNSVGITAFLDAMASPMGLPVYDQLLASGKLTARVVLAQFYDPSRTRRADGQVDYDSMVTQAKAIRAKYANTPLLHADFIKLFADGVLEGNPFSVPPTLPNAASLQPFLQPIFSVDAQGHATVTAYVDTTSTVCADVRAHPDHYASETAQVGFTKAHGYPPAQCAISSGQLQHSREIILEYVKRMHLAGFSLHIHAIGDRAVRTALDAIEAARAADGNSTTHDSLAHLQLVAPSDVARVGRDHLYVAFTFAWMGTDPDYDVTVIPFFQKVHGNSYEALHPAQGSYYTANTYPVKAIKIAGGILTAGSDAPVETNDPRPFINISRAITRALPGNPPLNPQQSITVREAIEAYTINGARMLNLQQAAGSIEIGKSADFIEVDQDILALADGGHPEKIAATHVLATWFRGKKVYARRGVREPDA